MPNDVKAVSDAETASRTADVRPNPLLRFNLVHHHARRIVHQAGLGAHDREDIEQDLTLHLLRRQFKYDPARASEITFADRIVRNQAATIRSALRARCRDSRRVVGTVEALEGAADPDDDNGHFTYDQRQYLADTVAAGRDGEAAAALQVDVRRVVAGLPGNLQDLCSKLVAGTVTQAAQDLGVDPSTVHRRIEKLRADFERAGLADYLCD